MILKKTNSLLLNFTVESPNVTFMKCFKICIHVLHLHPLCFTFLFSFFIVLHMHYVLHFALVIALFCLCTPVPVLFVVAAPFAPTCIKLSHPFYGICTSHNCDPLRHWFVRLIPLTRQPMILFSHPAAITKQHFGFLTCRCPVLHVIFEYVPLNQGFVDCF